MEEIINQMIDDMTELFRNVTAFLYGVLASVLGFFLPVKDIVHFLLILFLVDIIVGYRTARKLRGECFSPRIIWNKSVPRIVLTLIIILALYAWDFVYTQDYVHTYLIVGWFISGMLIYSIRDNAYKMTGWKVFGRVGDFITDKLTGGFIPKKEEKCDEK